MNKKAKYKISDGHQQPQQSKQQQQQFDYATSPTTTTTTTMTLTNKMALDTMNGSRPLIIKPTWRRYLILILYGICSMEKSFQWINLSTITNKVAFYYDVHNFAVNWTSVLFMITFIPLVLPTGLLIEQIGLRKAILIGQFGITLGALIKCFACDEDKFWLVLLGQVVVSLSEQFIFCVPSKIAAVWFPDEQVSIATGCGIFGNQFGIALGFLIPQALVRGRNDKSSIRIGLEELFYGTALIAVLTFIALLIFFADEPKNVPGAARLRQLELKAFQRRQNALNNNNNNNNDEHTSKSTSIGKRELYSLLRIIWNLLKDFNCTLLMIAYGLNVGTGYTIQTLLNQFIAGSNKQISQSNLSSELSSTTATNNNDDQVDLNKLVGHIGLVIIFFGMLGSLFWSYLCDLTHRYKLITCFLYGSFIISLIGFNGCLESGRGLDGRLLFPLAAFMGFSMIGYTTAGLDTLVEYTYPIPELLSTSLMVIWPQIFGTTLTFASSALNDSYGRNWATGFMVITLSLGLLISLYVREKLNRQQAIAEKRGELELAATSA